MPTKWANRSCGFSLLEILVVLVIIGVTMGFAMLSFGDFGRSRQLKASAEQVMNSVKYAKQRALIESKAYKIEIHKHYYLIAPSPKISTHPQANHRYQLPKGSKIKVIPHQKQSAIFVNSSGSVLPFRLLIQAKNTDKNIMLIGNQQGQLILKTQSTT